MTEAYMQNRWRSGADSIEGQLFQSFADKVENGP